MIHACPNCGSAMTTERGPLEAEVERLLAEANRRAAHDPFCYDVVRLCESHERLRAIVLPIGDPGIAWEPCAPGHTPTESRKMEAARKAHDAAYRYAREAREAAEAADQQKPSSVSHQPSAEEGET